MSNTELIEFQEALAIQWFNQFFGKHIKSTYTTPDGSRIDYIVTASTGQVIFIEFKIRSSNYSIAENSHSIIIEESKLQEFKQLQKQNPQAKMIYLTYFKDGLISFNITERIKQKSIELNYYKMKLNHQTYGNQQTESKLVSSLSYQPNQYKDQMIVYTEQQKNNLIYYSRIYK